MWCFISRRFLCLLTESVDSFGKLNSSYIDLDQPFIRAQDRLWPQPFGWLSQLNCGYGNRRPYVHSSLNGRRPKISNRYLITVLLLLNIFFTCGSVSYGYETREKVKFDIPYDSLIKDRREEIREIVAKHTIFRVLQDVEFKVDESIIIFMMDHPVFLSATLRAMKIRDYLIKKRNDGMYFIDDRKGIRGKFETIYSGRGQKYYYCIGGYYGLFLKLAGRGAILFEYRGIHGNPARTYINANVYTRVDNIVLGILIKILKPVIKLLMDKKIYKFIDETQKLAKEITLRPEKVYQTVKESGYANEAALVEFKELIF